MKLAKLDEGIELSRFKFSYCLLVVMRATVFDWKRICPSSGELARQG